MERKLRELQKYESKSGLSEGKKQPEETCSQGASRIKFKATSTEELRKEAIRKDK